MSTEKTAEQLAREWLESRAFGEPRDHRTNDVASLTALLESYGARVRAAALEEAAATCDGVIADFRQGVISAAAWTAGVAASRIRALAAANRDGGGK